MRGIQAVAMMRAVLSIVATSATLGFVTEVARADEAPNARAEGFRSLAVALAQANRTDDALTAINRAFTFAPNWSELYFLRAGIHKRIAQSQRSSPTTETLRHLDEARKDLEQYEKLDPDAMDVVRVDREIMSLGRLKSDTERDIDTASANAKLRADEASAASRAHWGWVALSGASLAASTVVFVYGVTNLKRNCDGNDASGDPYVPSADCIAPGPGGSAVVFPNQGPGPKFGPDDYEYYDPTKKTTNLLGVAMALGGLGPMLVSGIWFIYEILSSAGSQTARNAAPFDVQTHVSSVRPEPRLTFFPLITPSFGGVGGTF